MIHRHRSASIWLLLLIGFVAGSLACTRPELIGADLLENEAFQVGFTDTISLRCTQLTEDRVITYSGENGRQLVRCLVGNLDDPFFGRSEASFYSELFLLSGSSAFLGRPVDSVVVSLRYDTLGNYGDLSQQISLEIYEMLEEFDPEADLYSDYEPMIESQPISVPTTIVPSPYDSIYIQSRGDSARVPAMVRMHMSAEFIQDLLAQDSSTFESADSFRMWIKGLHVKAKTNTVENTMLAFDLRSFFSEMTVYYHTDTIASEVSFGFTDGLDVGIHHVRFKHDYAGSAAQMFVDNPSLSDSLLFVQGMSGLNFSVSLPGLPNINDILINKAELEFYAAEIPGDDLMLYPRLTQLINAVENEDGDLDFSEDVNIPLVLFGGLGPFGGALTDTDTLGMSPKKYVMNVTTSLQDIYKGNTENLFYIIPFFKPNVPNRVMLYGPAHPTHPARLRLTYTIFQ